VKSVGDKGGDCARTFHFQNIGKRIDDGHTDAVQTTGCFISFAVKLTARMQLGHDDFKRGFSRHLWVFIHWNAATIVADGYEAFSIEADFNEVGVACNRFVIELSMTSAKR
jgi:hypothetical protein